MIKIGKMPVKRRNSNSKQKPPSDFETYRALLSLCKQDTPVKFKNIFKSRECDLEKLGEGLFGKCFAKRGHGQTIRSVYKILPINHLFLPKHKQPTTLYAAFIELRILKALKSLRKNALNQTKSFCKLKKSWIVVDEKPRFFKWDEVLKNRRQNFAPKKRFFKNLSCKSRKTPQKSFYLVYKMGYGGTTIDSEKTHKPIREIFSIICQVICAFAVAEESIEFEHRDIHPKNILMKATKSKTIQYVIKGEKIKIPSYGNKVTIVDFGYSRAKIGQSVLYTPLQVPREDYRYILSRGNWKDFYPTTNIHSIEWLLLKILKAATLFDDQDSTLDNIDRKIVKNFNVNMNNLCTSHNFFNDFLNPILQKINTPLSHRAGCIRNSFIHLIFK